MLLNEEQALIPDTAARFSRDHLLPQPADWERSSYFLPDSMAEMGELGFLGMLVPADKSGVTAGHLAYAVMLEEIAADCGDLSTPVSGHNSVGCLPIIQYGNEDQQDRYLPAPAGDEKLSCFYLTEPHAGSDASSLQTKAKHRNGHYVLNVTKQFVTTGKNADIALVFERCRDSR